MVAMKPFCQSHNLFPCGLTNAANITMVYTYVHMYVHTTQLGMCINNQLIPVEVSYNVVRVPIYV